MKTNDKLLLGVMVFFFSAFLCIGIILAGAAIYKVSSPTSTSNTSSLPGIPNFSEILNLPSSNCLTPGDYLTQYDLIIQAATPSAISLDNQIALAEQNEFQLQNTSWVDTTIVDLQALEQEANNLLGLRPPRVYMSVDTEVKI